MTFDGTLKAMFAIASRRQAAALAILSLITAASEGLGFVLLVPIIALFAGSGPAMPLPFALPDMPLSAMLAMFVLLVAVRAVAEIARRLVAQDLRAGLVDSLRMRAVKALLGANWRWTMTQRRGASEALIITNIDRAGYAAEMATALVRLTFALVALVAAAMVVSPAAALTGGAAGGLVLLLYRPLTRRARALGNALSRSYDSLHERLGETLGAIRIIKSLGREGEAAKALSDELRGLRQAERGYVRDAAIGHAALQVGGALVAACLAWLALAWLGLPLAIVLPLAAIFVRALPLLGEAQVAMQGWSHASPAIEDALAMIERAGAAAEPEAATRAPRLTRTLSFERVSLTHRPGRDALMEVSLDIEAGTMVALTGRSGAGKSTLADLASGLIGPDAGAVSIDGTRLDAASRRAWRERVAYVQQEPLLFSGTVRQNLLWARPGADEAQVKRALEEAAAQFVFSLPEGIDCDLGEGGRALSGGERQRIALARALMRDPDLIVLDEATSAVDSESEQAIAAALHSMTGKRTVLAIAHRGLLTEIADRVVRIDRGRIATD